MTKLATLEKPFVPVRKPAVAPSLPSLLGQLANAAGADLYLLADPVKHDEGEWARVLAANWTYDAVVAVGHETIAALLSGPQTTHPGAVPRITVPAKLAADGQIDPDAALAMVDHGIAELSCLGLRIGRKRLAAVFCATRPGRLAPGALARGQMEVCHALSSLYAHEPAAAPRDPLSDRERECLSWVSEGKTTEEVALILDVSSNTVNSYLTHAIQKLSATNRPMAIAAAIRNGIL